MPEDWHGWFCAETAAALASVFRPEMRLLLECGTWLGYSAREMLLNCPAAAVVCIDTWAGSPEHWADTGCWKSRLPTLFEVCQKNLWPWRDRLIMLRQDSLVGLGEVFAAGGRPDLIYLDSKHSLGRVTAELAVSLELFPKATVVGDDFNNAAVRLAAVEHHRLTGRPLTDRDGAAFIFHPWHEV